MNHSASESSSQAKLKWACRRGMKELDLVLIPFIEHNFHWLNQQQQTDFERLLDLDDLTLFNALFKHEKLDDPFLQALINLLKLFHQQTSQ